MVVYLLQIAHRVAVQLFPLDGARGDRFGQHERDVGVDTAIRPHGLHVAAQPLGGAVKRLDPVCEPSFVPAALDDLGDVLKEPLQISFS